MVTDDFVAVIDGSTSKSSRRYSLFSTNGALAMHLVSKVLLHAKKDLTLSQFCREATQAVRKKYRKKELPHLSEHPEDRMAASAAVFSRLRRELWLVGDCQCLVNGQLYDNPKPYEDSLAQMRADEARRYLAAGVTVDQLRHKDTARDIIIPHMLEAMKGQNKTYAVIDGFDIPMDKVKRISLTFEPFDIVLATDGYPVLMPTLNESEATLRQLLTNDPLNISQFKATKAWMAGNDSFDDRAYIRFLC